MGRGLKKMYNNNEKFDVEHYNYIKINRNLNVVVVFK